MCLIPRGLPSLLIQFHRLCVCAYVGVYSYEHKGCQQLHTVSVAGDGMQAENPSENQGVGPQGILKMQFN